MRIGILGKYERWPRRTIERERDRAIAIYKWDTVLGAPER